jgi:hypothetical protein
MLELFLLTGDDLSNYILFCAFCVFLVMSLMFLSLNLSFPSIVGLKCNGSVVNVCYRSFSRPRPPLHCVAKFTKSAHAHWVVGKWEPFSNAIAISKWFHFEMVLIYQPPNVDFATQRNGDRGREKDLFHMQNSCYCLQVNSMYPVGVASFSQECFFFYIYRQFLGSKTKYQ